MKEKELKRYNAIALRQSRVLRGQKDSRKTPGGKKTTPVKK